MDLCGYLFFLFVTGIEHLVQRHPPFQISFGLYGFGLWAGLLFEIQAVGPENVAVVAVAAAAVIVPKVVNM